MRHLTRQTEARYRSRDKAVDSSRPVCARTDRSDNGLRTRKFDPEQAFKIGLTNGRDRRESGLRLADVTKIEWTDATFNPWIGCQHVSPGCDLCYAEAQSGFAGGPLAEAGDRTPSGSTPRFL
jgi:hypothetical protein